MGQTLKENLNFKKYQGADIRLAFDELAELRIQVFREFPYLYEGDKSYEFEYLSTYTQSARSMAFLVFDGSTVVGATTCLPLADETEEIKAPFTHSNRDISGIFYFGESIILKPYRGLGLGHLFFDEREAHADSFGEYDSTCFCAVNRGTDHPSQPKDYRPNDAFWIKRGYVKNSSLTTYMSWLDVGDEKESMKLMEFWERQLAMSGNREK